MAEELSGVGTGDTAFHAGMEIDAIRFASQSLATFSTNNATIVSIGQ